GAAHGLVVGEHAVGDRGIARKPTNVAGEENGAAVGRTDEVRGSSAARAGHDDLPEEQGRAASPKVRSNANLCGRRGKAQARYMPEVEKVARKTLTRCH